MSHLLLTNIDTLGGITEAGCLKKSGAEMNTFGVLNNAWLRIVDGKIDAYGSMADFDAINASFSNMPQLDCSNRWVLPSFADSHTHLVFAATREEEFVMRIKGKSYEEIAAAGGGILNSAAKLARCSEDDLFDAAKERLKEVIAYGTGSIEIKSGYGLSTESELKMLRVIRRLKEWSPIPVKSTFLGAHAIPSQFKENRAGYLRLIVEEMLPAVASEQLADYMDVFCDQGFFTPEETDYLLEAGYRFGLKPKIHGNELGYSGGVQVAVRNHALSVDHLEYTGDEEIAALLAGGTMPVALPGCSFFLGIPYAPLRKMIDAGLPVALASDFNPGSTPNGRMGFVVALACAQMKLTPEEAFNAASLNGANAMELSSTHGSVALGKQANLMVLKPGSRLAHIPYFFGMDQTELVIVNGEKQ